MEITEGWVGVHLFFAVKNTGSKCRNILANLRVYICMILKNTAYALSLIFCFWATIRSCNMLKFLSYSIIKPRNMLQNSFWKCFVFEQGVMLFFLAQKQGCGPGSRAGQNPYSLSCRIRIRIQNTDTDPDPGVKNCPPILQKSLINHPKKSFSHFTISFLRKRILPCRQLK